jgi:hypothetical protein
MELLRYLKDGELWIYVLLGLVGLYFLRKFLSAWQELRVAAFGLERESAQSRLNQAASWLVLVMSVAIAEFVLVSFVVPAVPGASPLFTPTLDLLASPTYTLPAATPGTNTPGELTPGAPLPQTPTPLAAAPGCLPGQIFIASPRDGEEISGGVTISGTVNIPDFGFYKFEIKPQGDPNWRTILAGNEVRQNATLGTWNTSLLSPGDYQLSLVVTDNKGQLLPACIINVRVKGVAETPQP